MAGPNKLARASQDPVVGVPEPVRAVQVSQNLAMRPDLVKDDFVRNKLKALAALDMSVVCPPCAQIGEGFWDSRGLKRSLHIMVCLSLWGCCCCSSCIRFL